MADALTSVRAIRAADKVTYIDHFGGDSEGPVSTAVLASHFIHSKLWETTYELKPIFTRTHMDRVRLLLLLSSGMACGPSNQDASAARSASSRAIAEVKVNGRARGERDGGQCGHDG